jgi:hypothetical protein
VTVDLLVALATMPDPRKARGLRHRLVTVLAEAVSAVPAGACTYVAIAEGAHNLPVSVRVRLGMGRRAPSESTFRRILQAVDTDALDRVVSSWLTQRTATATATAAAATTATAIAVAGRAPGRRTAPPR